MQSSLEPFSSSFYLSLAASITLAVHDTTPVITLHQHCRLRSSPEVPTHLDLFFPPVLILFLKSSLLPSRLQSLLVILTRILSGAVLIILSFSRSQHYSSTNARHVPPSPAPTYQHCRLRSSAEVRPHPRHRSPQLRNPPP